MGVPHGISRPHLPAPTDWSAARNTGSEQLAAVPTLVHVLLNRTGLVPFSPFDCLGGRGADPSGISKGRSRLTSFYLTDGPNVIAVVTPPSVNQQSQGTTVCDL